MQRTLAGEIDAVIGCMADAQSGLSELIELMLDNRHHRGRVCRVAAVLGQLRELYAPQLRQRGIELVLEAPPELTLDLSPLYLFQPVSNLVLNVYKHMHRGHGGHAWVRAEVQSGFLGVEVGDNGPGIAEQDREWIFEPGFSRAPDPAERFGLGLYISRLLAEEAGGRLVLVESWRGAGSLFRLTLPIPLG